MRAMRVAWAVLVSILVLAAGCGGEDLGAGEASGAELVKPGALVYWEIETDPDSDQWSQVEELVRRFPDGDKWLTQLEAELESESEIEWQEVRDVIGGRTAIVVYGRSEANVQFVALMQPDDPERFLELAAQANQEEEDPEDRMVVRRLDDWVAISDEAASIDAALKEEGGQSLAGDEGFTSAMEELPADSLSRVYVDVAAALEVFGGEAGPEAEALSLLGLDKLDFAGAWATARDDGAELAGVVSGEGAARLFGASEPYSSQLLELVPADAFAFVSFQGRGVTEQFESLRSNPLYGLAFESFEEELGVGIEDLVALFDGEVAFYAAPGTPIPELTLLLDSENPAQARQRAERLLRSLAEREGGEVTEDGAVTTALFEGFAVNLATVENTLVLTTKKDAIEELQGSGDRLAGTDRFEDALEAAGVPDEYTGLAYVDLAQTIELVMGFATSAGETVPSEVSRNLEPLRSVVAYGDLEGDVARSRVFVEID